MPFCRFCDALALIIIVTFIINMYIGSSSHTCKCELWTDCLAVVMETKIVFLVIVIPPHDGFK